MATSWHIRSSVAGYIFWTSFSALPPMIWFYPLNELDITGYEAFVLVLFLPILLQINLISNIFRSKIGNKLLYLTMIICLLSFQTSTTFWRLCAIAVGATASVMKLTCDLSEMRNSLSKKNEIVIGYIVGYTCLLVTRIMYKTITPAFNDVRTNWLIVGIGASAFVFDVVAKNIEEKSKDQHLQLTSCTVTTGLGFGAALYILLGVFGEVTVPFRWIVAPHPNTGPCPTPWGVAILLCLIFGFWLSKYPSLVFHPVWSILGLLSFTTIYLFDGNEGFFGSCVLAVFIASVVVTYLFLFSYSPNPAISMTLAVAALLVPAFYSVWTVAYNFVPLGVYTREFTGLLITFCCAAISIGLFRNRHFAQHRLTTIGEGNFFWPAMLTLLVIGSAAMTYRHNEWQPGRGVTDEPNPPKNANDITVMIWTYHFGYDNQGWPSLDRTVKLINDIGADVIGLLETDASRLYMGNNDLASWLAESLHMYVDYGPATKKHTWGSMLLSKYPILASEHHLLPSPHGELAPAVSAVLDVRGERLGIVVTHMGNDRDDLDRKLQTLALSNITASFIDHGLPVVFLGYVTSKPFQRDYTVFTSNGRLKDIDQTDRSRFCEYIFYQGLTKLAYARISKGTLSDTEVQSAKFRIPSRTAVLEDFIRLTTKTDDVPKKQLYSNVFGEFREGHYYGIDHKFHMSTPKYFLP